MVEYGDGKYCSVQCLGKARRKRVDFVCAECGKGFEIPQCRDGLKFCSYECLERWRMREKRTECVCEECGKTFVIPTERFEDGRGRYCSKTCQKKHFATEGPASWYEARSNAAAVLSCQRCGKEFAAGAESKRRFCSLVCRMLYRGETLIEKMIREELEQRGIAFDQQVLIDRFLVDFLLFDTFSVIECDGEYWHRSAESKARDRLKGQVLAEKGYRVFRFTEREIRKSPSACVDHVLMSE
ncbi:MAG: DUF559 domain-containing protein [Chloroflexi bacterium]|nr:DUF559 domain-containing protein [Chloroflexota bacterium]